jgi:hypothetical protein
MSIFVVSWDIQKYDPEIHAIQIQINSDEKGLIEVNFLKENEYIFIVEKDTGGEIQSSEKSKNHDPISFYYYLGIEAYYLIFLKYPRP